MEHSINKELGTHRNHLPPKALDPQYVVLDDSRPADLLQEAIAQARSLRFVKATGLGPATDPAIWEALVASAHTDWSGFLGDANGPLATELQRFFDSPEDYVPSKDQPLSQPHVALFVAFLHILRHASAEINGFTQRHLDHYLRDALQLKPLLPQPAQTYVTLSLSPGETAAYLPKGTKLMAGEGDEASMFETAGDLEVHQGRIGRIAALRTTCAPAGLHQQLDPQAPEGGMAGIRAGIWAAGPHTQSFPHGWDSFEAIYADLDTQRREEFPTAYLQVSPDEFRRMMELRPAKLPLSADEEELFAKWECLHARMVIAATHPTGNTAGVGDAKTLRDKLSVALFNGGSLPDYKGGAVKLSQLYADSRQVTSPVDCLAALDYIRNVLYLEATQFQVLFDLDQSNQGLPKYPESIMEATIAKAAAHAPQLLRKQVTQVVATADATTLQRSPAAGGASWFPYGTTSTLVRGSGLDKYGLIVESPVLQLSEGDRKIVVTLDFAPHNFAIFQGLFDLSAPSSVDWYGPFAFQVSGAEDWIPLDWRGTAPRFFPATHQVEFTLAVSSSLPAVTGPGEKFPDGSLAGKAALLCIRLAPPPGPNHRTGAWSHELFAQVLKVQRMQIAVTVREVRGLQAENHEGEIKISAPFEPFGSAPATYSEFMFAHPEICFKQLQSLDITMEWMELPADVKAYYDPYFAQMGTSPAITNVPHAKADFKARLDLVTDGRTATVGAPMAFLDTALSIQTAGIQPLKTQYSPEEIAEWEAPTEWPRYFKFVYVTPWNPQQEYQKAERRLTAALMELSSDFAAASLTYTSNPTGSTLGVTNQKRFDDANAALKAINQVILMPPFVPKLKGITMGYTATTQILLNEWAPDAHRPDRLYHQVPFGHRPLQIGNGSPQPLFPTLQGEGHVLIGLQDVAPEDPLSFLLKVQTGSGNPDVEPPAIHWSYFSQSGWRDLPSFQVLRDDTGGLTQTGLLQLKLPQDASVAATELPGGMHWLMASVHHDTDHLPDWENLHLHAIDVVQVVRQDIVDKWSFPAGSITATEDGHPQIETVGQPYAARFGKPQEDPRDFYRRVSERLRHKNRAVTAWDFEHLCLQRFPSLYAVKTLQATAAVGKLPGELSLVLVPDLRQQRFSNPFQPKFGFGELNEISNYLRQLASPAVRLRAVNPRYRPVMVGTTINFKDGMSSALGKHMIEQRLKAFLAPWAINNATAMTFGGRLYVSEVVDVLQAEPYVDFVGKTRLFVLGANGEYEEAKTTDGDTSAYIEVPDTDVITSDSSHLVNEIADESAQSEIWEGISWMVINSDFKVSIDPDSPEEVYDEDLGITWMVIGKDFKVMPTSTQNT